MRRDRLPREAEDLKHVLLILVAVVLQVALVGGVAKAGALDFQDGFNTFDTTRWSKEGHYLGRSYLSPANSSVANGNLRLKLPARTLNGAEIFSKNFYMYGSYSARMKLPNAPSSITGFFLYSPPDYDAEIDIELYNDSSRRIMFTTYADGRRTHTRTALLPFDPTAGFHQYRFDYSPLYMRFYVDGVLMQQWTDGITMSPMRLYANAWFPTWLEGRRPKQDRYVLVDSISHTQL